MKYLTEKEIIFVNKTVLNRENQKFSGIQYPEGLSLVVEQPQMVVFGQELYPSLWLKAAYILQKITKKHIFADGNKRTAYLTTVLFLEINNYKLKLTTDEGEALVMQVTLASDTEEEMQKVAELLQRKSHSIK